MEEFNDKKVLKSEYNEAGFQIIRLNEYWLDYGRSIRNRNYPLTYDTLENIWVELSNDVDDKDKVYMRKMDALLAKNIHKPTSFRYLLRQKAIFLKKIQEKVGKGGKKTSGYEDMF